MHLSEIYRNMLKEFNIVEVEPENLLHILQDGEMSVLNVAFARHGEPGTYPVILPTKEVIESDNNPNVLKFHPLAESPFADRSEIFNTLQLVVSAHLCAVAMGLSAQLVNMSCNMSDSDNYTNATLKVLRDFPPVKTDSMRKKIIEYYKRICSEHTFIRGERPVVRLNVGRNKRDDISALRWAEVVAPILESIDDDDMRIIGLKAPNKAAFNTASHALHLVFGIEEGEHKRPPVGTDSQTAPYFQALLKAAMDVFEHINGINKALGKHGRPEYHTDTQWMQAILDDPTAWAKQIPVNFEGNTGAAKGKTAVANTVDRQDAKPVEANLKPMTKPREADNPTPEQKMEPPMIEETRPHFSGGLAGALTAVNAAKPATQPAQDQPVEQPAKKTSGLTVQERPAASPASSGHPKLTVNKERDVHVTDSAGQPLYDVRNRPVMLPRSEIPQGLFLMEQDRDGYPIFDDDGMPKLVGVTRDELEDYMDFLRSGGNRDPRGGHAYNDPRDRYADRRSDPRYRDNRDPRHGQPHGPRYDNRRSAPQQPRYAGGPAPRYHGASPAPGRYVDPRDRRSPASEDASGYGWGGGRYR